MTYPSEAERQFVHEPTAYVLEEAGADVDRARLRARALAKRIDDTGPLDGPRCEGEKWRDRD